MRVCVPRDVAAGEEVLVELLQALRGGQILELGTHGVRAEGKAEAGLGGRERWRVETAKE